MFMNILSFIGLGLGVAAAASIAVDLRRWRRSAERHTAIASERHAEELAHLSAIRVAIVGHGAVIEEALRFTTIATRDALVDAHTEENSGYSPLPPPAPIPAVDLRVSLPAPPDATVGADDVDADEELIRTATFNRAHLSFPNSMQRREESEP